MGNFCIEDMMDALKISGIGLWRVEVENGKKMRFYADSITDELLGIDYGITPEERFVFLVSHVYKEDLDTFINYQKHLKEDGNAEIVYRYEHPKQGIIYIRCGGKRDESIDKFACYKGYNKDCTESVMIEKKRIFIRSCLSR